MDRIHPIVHNKEDVADLKRAIFEVLDFHGEGPQRPGRIAEDFNTTKQLYLMGVYPVPQDLMTQATFAFLYHDGKARYICYAVATSHLVNFQEELHDCPLMPSHSPVVIEDHGAYCEVSHDRITHKKKELRIANRSTSLVPPDPMIMGKDTLILFPPPSEWGSPLRPGFVPRKDYAEVIFYLKLQNQASILHEPGKIVMGLPYLAAHSQIKSVRVLGYAKKLDLHSQWTQDKLPDDFESVFPKFAKETEEKRKMRDQNRKVSITYANKKIFTSRDSDGNVVETVFDPATTDSSYIVVNQVIDLPLEKEKEPKVKLPEIKEPRPDSSSSDDDN